VGSPAGGHYFDADPAARSRPSTVELTLPDMHLELATDRGVFAADRVDPGTKYLLLEAPAPPAHGVIVDLGCGYGAIAVTMARRAPEADVVAVDVNGRARELCRGNAELAETTNVRVLAPDEVPSDLQCDALYSNPPIRIGKPALHALLRDWFTRLRPGGHAWLVVHRHLGADSLARWLVDEGFETRRLGSRAGYRLLEVGP
jgi:16S rRNA (guanine1207-N2)-methyltransferase